MSDKMDALGLLASARRVSVRIGPNEIGTALVTAKITSALNQMPNAQFVFDYSLTPGIADYFGELAVTFRHGDSDRPSFTGSVVNAVPSSSGVEIDAVGMVSLTESTTPGMVTRAISPSEMIYVLARSSGIREDRLRIDGLAELPMETFEVLTPVIGVTAGEPTPFGDVILHPADIASRLKGVFPSQEELRAEFDAPLYALAMVTSARMLDAEERGLAAIDLALAWLTAQLRYGMARSPDGAVLPFNRRNSLAQPTRRDIVSVRGLSTGREWLRHPLASKQQRHLSLADSSRPFDRVLPRLTLQDQYALLAFARATREDDSLARVHALWEAIEFYVSGVSVDALFSKSERRLILDSMPGLSEVQRERMKDLVGNLNSAPLGVRLRKAMDDEEVPISDGEINLLWKLRKLRNDVVHGRQSELPAPEDVDYATSIVARMLVHRVVRSGH